MEIDQIDFQSAEWHLLPDLLSSTVGGKVIFATDDFFAEAENLINPQEPIWDPSTYTEYGKLMDGWETRRKRTLGHDWGVFKLGISGVIKGLMIDTAFFTGNFVPRISLQAAYLPNPEFETWSLRHPLDKVRGTAASKEQTELAQKIGSDQWEEILPFTHLRSGNPDTRYHYFQLTNEKPFSHVRVNYFPDGGVARLRLYGEASPNWSDLLLHSEGKPIDLAAVENGGQIIAFSNAHYGQPTNLLNPGRGTSMKDGWETARKLTRPPIYELGDDGHIILPGEDFVIIALGTAGIIDQIIVDTNHYKGNFPESCKIDAYLVEKPQNDPQSSSTPKQPQLIRSGSELKPRHVPWVPLLARTTLTAHAIHQFERHHHPDFIGQDHCAVTHVRISIFPDGGVMRLRLLGRPMADPTDCKPVPRSRFL